MTRIPAIRKREKLAAQFSSAAGVLRGSLLQASRDRRSPPAAKFADGFIAEAVADLWEPWMRHADKGLEDNTLLLIIQQQFAKRCKDKTRRRKATPAEVVLRMLLLKHVRDWSYEVLSREVRSNLAYREFTRIGGEKVPGDRTMGNLARQLGPEIIEKLHESIRLSLRPTSTIRPTAP